MALFLNHDSVIPHSDSYMYTTLLKFKDIELNAYNACQNNYSPSI